MTQVIALEKDRNSIPPLVPDDTAEYARLRLKAAGCDKELFTADAISMLHEAASGALRDIDRIATAALRETARKKRKPARPGALTVL